MEKRLSERAASFFVGGVCFIDPRPCLRFVVSVNLRSRARLFSELYTHGVMSIGTVLIFFVCRGSCLHETLVVSVFRGDTIAINLRMVVANSGCCSLGTRTHSMHPYKRERKNYT
jgi:hypothetical protein